MKPMDPDARRRLLLSSPLFDALPEAAVAEILSQATDKPLRRGQTIFQKGDEGSYMVAVLSGRMRIHDTTPDGGEITLNMIDAGEVFGEIALLDGNPRSADATALEDSQLMLVERKHFLPHLMSNHDLALRLIEVLCERLRETSETLGNVAMLGLPGRLARRLLTLAAGYGTQANGRILVDIPLTDSELGRLVGCTRETINKQMRAWEEKGVVARESKRRIALCQPHVLKRIAGQM